MAAQFPSMAAWLRYAPVRRGAGISQSVQKTVAQFAGVPSSVDSTASSAMSMHVHLLVAGPVLFLYKQSLTNSTQSFTSRPLLFHQSSWCTNLHCLASASMVLRASDTVPQGLCSDFSVLQLLSWQVFVCAVGQARCAAPECLPDCEGASGKLSCQARLGAIHRRCHRRHQS